MPQNYGDFNPWLIGGLPTTTWHDFYIIETSWSEHRGMTWLKYITDTSQNKHRGTIHKKYEWIHSEVTIISTRIPLRYTANESEGSKEEVESEVNSMNTEKFLIQWTTNELPFCNQQTSLKSELQTFLAANPSPIKRFVLYELFKFISWVN